MRASIRLTLCLCILCAAGALLSGCFRKHIVSTPPTQRSTQKAGTTQPAPAPTTPQAAPEQPVVSEQFEIIEETYVIDAADEGPVRTEVEESDLADEPPAQQPVKAQSTTAEQTPPAKAATTPEPKHTETIAETTEPTPAPTTQPDTEQVAKEKTASPAIEPEMRYYVQVGAFSEMDRANAVLETLINKGYEKSRLILKDDGLFRVQAGTFPDSEAAGNALNKLREEFGGAFLKKD